MRIPDTMQAMVFERSGQPLIQKSVPVPEPGPGQLLLAIRACAVCRTDLHVVDAELSEPKLPLIPGHEIVGVVIQVGEGGQQSYIGDRVGVPWLGYTCGDCRYCQRGQENLCPQARFTGYTLDGGFAEYMVADQRYCFPLPNRFSDVGAAPLLCAGLIGHRSYRMAGKEVERLGIYGFGAAAHILTQVAVHQGKQIYGFTRPGDTTAQEFAHRLGAVWVGGSDTAPPVELDAAIIFAPVGDLIPEALAHIAPGGTVVCGGIHMSDIPEFPYSLLWKERVLRSVANLTREDGWDFLPLAAEVPVYTETQTFPLEAANEALAALREGRLQGAAVLTPATPSNTGSA